MPKELSLSGRYVSSKRFLSRGRKDLIQPRQVATALWRKCRLRSCESVSSSKRDLRCKRLSLNAKLTSLARSKKLLHSWQMPTKLRWLVTEERFRTTNAALRSKMMQLCLQQGRKLPERKVSWKCMVG